MNPPLRVPLCDLQAQYREIQSEVEEAVLSVLRSGQVILGPEVQSFEDELAQFCDTHHAVGCGSGTEALSLALRALDVGPGDEVILPPFTFFATVGCICRSGAIPVFVDIDPVSWNLDPEQVEAAITPRTRAILPVHLYGQCAEMNLLQELAHRHRLWIIEDAAQAIGAEYQNRRAGSIGHLGCFSFYPSKNVGAYGEAGAVTTSNSELAHRMKTLRVHGMEPKYYHKEIGWNARIDAIQAAVLRVKLRKAEDWTIARQQAAARYDWLIEEHQLSHVLKRPTIVDQRRHVFNQYVVEVAEDNRDPLVAHLRQNGIGCEIYYPMPLHLQPCLQHLNYREGQFPISESASRSVIAFPMYPELREDQQHLVLETCSTYFRLHRQVA